LGAVLRTLFVGFLQDACSGISHVGMIPLAVI
jgi:hypothetical protein